MLSRYMGWKEEYLYTEEDKKMIINSLKRLIEYPLFQEITPIPQFANYFRCSIDYLISEGYIDECGNPLQLCGLLSHLFYLHPSNYILISFLMEGLFEQYIEKCNEKDLSVQLLIILANLFCKIPFHKNQFIPFNAKHNILKPLPSIFYQSVKQHNKRALEILKNYLICCSRAYSTELGEDNLLPLSKIRMEKKIMDIQPKSLLDRIQQISIPFEIRSSFVAISGLGDNFHSIQELISTLRNGLVIDDSLLPILDLDSKKYNAYLIQFLTDHKLKSLLDQNLIVYENYIFYSIKDFLINLKAIILGLQKR